MNTVVTGLLESIAQYQAWIDESLDMGVLGMLYQHLHFLQWFLEFFTA